MGVKPGTGPYKSSLPLYLVYVLSELLLGPVPGFSPVIFGGCVV
jgi:hypothetical protein